MIKKEGLFKRLKNIEGKIKSKDKKDQNQLKMKNSQKYLKMDQLSAIKSLKKLCC